MAQRPGGEFLLRIEDIDATRCRPEYEQAIDQDLHWLGLSWPVPIRRQSEHLVEYAGALDDLRARGLVYPSFETRADIARLTAGREEPGRHWTRDPDGAPLYPGHDKRLTRHERDRLLASGRPCAWRLDMEAAMAKAGPLTWTETGLGPDGEAGQVAAKPEAWGDVILGRKDTPASYHLAVVLDDARQGITHVVRGTDLFWSTSVHRLLQQLLGLPAPIYHHHRLIRDADGRKLSKSTRSTALRELRDQGLTAVDIRRLVGLA